MQGRPLHRGPAFSCSFLISVDFFYIACCGRLLFARFYVTLKIMGEINSNVPLWLKLKKEYIDDSFEDVLRYLRACLNFSSDDSFFQTTLELVRDRVGDLIEALAVPVTVQEEEADTNETKAFQARLLAAGILCGNLPREEDAAVCLMRIMAAMEPKYAAGLTALAAKCLSRQLYRIGVNWDDVVNFSPQLFAHKLLNNTSFEKGMVVDRQYGGYGCMLTVGGSLLVFPGTPRTSRAVSKHYATVLRIADAVDFKAPGNMKMSESEVQDIDCLDAFADDYTAIQRNVRTSSGTFSEYSDGDILEVRVLSTGNEGIEVESVDVSYGRVSGQLYTDSLNIMLYRRNDFAAALRPGDVLDAELHIRNGVCSFSVARTFLSFIVDDARRNIGTAVVAQALKFKSERTLWWTELGYPASTPKGQEYTVGHKAYLKFNKVGDNGFVYAMWARGYDEESDCTDMQKTKRECIEDFVNYSEEDVTGPEPLPISRAAVFNLLHLLYVCQKEERSPRVRYRTVCAMKIVAALLGDGVSEKYAGMLMKYIRNLICFARGDYRGMHPLRCDDETSGVFSRRSAIVDILMKYGEGGESETLDAIVSSSMGGVSNPADGILVRLAKLVQSCNRLEGIVPDSMRNIIKREIVRLLSIESESGEELEGENGVYLGLEDSQKEFKTSFVYPPDNNMRPFVKKQRLNVLKAVCAFLNSEAGGILYMGVSDLGYVVGLDEDLKYLSMNLDAYMRFIQDSARKAFGLDVLTHIDIKPMYDGRVVALRIEPYGYGVVELEGVPYVRVNNESREMTDKVRRNVRNRRRFSTRVRSVNSAAVAEAVDNGKRAIFHDYVSSSSGEVRDRLLEPFAIVAQDTAVWCWDVEAECNKVFYMNRAGNVEVLEEGWKCESRHEQGDMDIFRHTGSSAVKIAAELDMTAAVMLSQMFPESANQLHRQESGQWRLEAEVFGITGFGRFYMSMADHIKIISAPGLGDYVRNFVKSNLTRDYSRKY